jgi:hypothetical protein
MSGSALPDMTIRWAGCGRPVVDECRENLAVQSIVIAVSLQCPCGTVRFEMWIVATQCISEFVMSQSEQLATSQGSFVFNFAAVGSGSARETRCIQ